MKQNKPYLVAVTGGIATGKSTTINYIKLRGYSVIDFDFLAHQILEDEIVIKELVNIFGNNIITNNKIDRKKLASIVFNNKTALDKLNLILHPKIYSKGDLEIEKYSSDRIIFLDIPLLFETKNTYKNFYSKINETWVVTCNKRVQITRLMIRDKITREDAEKKIESQLTLKLKEKLGDIIFYNNSDIYTLYDDLRIELMNLEKRVSLK